MRSKRLEKLPPYLFVEIDRLKSTFREKGKRLLDLGIGDPDIGPPKELLDSLKKALDVATYHRYPPDQGLPCLIEAIRHWAAKQFDVNLDSKEILVTIGSKEAIGHLPLAVANEGDVILVPDPGYPVYRSSSVLSGAEYRTFPLNEERGFLPDFTSFDEAIVKRAKALILNYPNNPTSAIADKDDFVEAVEFVKGREVLLVNDAAYGELTYDREFFPLFTIARDAGIPFIEFFSFSKTFSITGWRVGFAIGREDVISSLARVKSNLDSGVFGAIQEAVAVTMEDHYDEVLASVKGAYRKRIDLLDSYLKDAHLSYRKPGGTFYFWIRVPVEMDSVRFCRMLIESEGVVATPGVGFGENGEGYFRLSVTSDEETIAEAGEAFKKLSKNDWKL